MTLAFLAGTLAQVIAAAVLGWFLSGILLRRATRDGEAHWELGLPERALLALAAYVLWCVALMVLHLVTGGAVFGTSLAVPVVAILVIVLGRHTERPRGVPWLPVIGFVVVLSAVFLLPDLTGGPGIRTGDPPWHLGWTEQLLHGEAIPTGPAPELGRNAYPWGLHAVMATMTRTIPGSTPLESLEALHVLLVFAIPLAAACLARRVRRDAGWAAAAAGGLVGGWGWVLARGAAFVTSPSQARYGADLVVASPNSVYELFAPALPRELGLALLGAFGLVFAIACKSGDVRARVGAGTIAGVVGLVSVPMFVSALAWSAAGSLAARKGERLRTVATVATIGLAVFALWAGPVATAYVRYGGFVDITPQLGKEWPLVTSLGSWGLLLPFAVIGGVLTWRARDVNARVVSAFAAGAVALLALALAREAFDWRLAGNATLLHQGRVWPPAHLLGAALAGIAATAVFSWSWRRRRALAVAGAASLLAVGVASPVLASRALADVLERHEDGFVYGRADLAPGSFVDRVAARLGPADTVAVDEPGLAFHLFELSGCRLAAYDDPRLDGNDLRIRYADLAERWDARIAGPGFEPDYEVIPAPLDEHPALRTGVYGGETWALRYYRPGLPGL